MQGDPVEIRMLEWIRREVSRETRRRTADFCCRLLGVLLVSTLATSSVEGSDANGNAQPLRVGDRVEREIRGGDLHSYRIEAESLGQTWKVAVDQRGIDLMIRAFDSAGGADVSVDAPFGRQGLERLILKSAEARFFVVQIEPSSPLAVAGSYEISVAPLSIQKSGKVSPRDQAEIAMSEAAAGSWNGTLNDRRRAVERYREAAELFRLAGHRRDQALASYAVARLSLDLGDLESAKETLNRALPLWKGLGDLNFEGVALNDLGLIYLQLGDKEKSKLLFERSISKQQEIGNVFGEAVPRSNLCLFLLHFDDPRDSAPCFRRVHALYAEAGEEEQSARALLNLGGAFDTLGEPKEAASNYQLAISKFRALDYRLGEAQALHNLGMTLKRLGQLQRAMEHFRSALQVFESEGHLRWQARAASNLGDALALLGDSQRALSYYEQSLEIRRQVNDLKGEGITLGRIAEARRQQGELHEALRLHHQGRALLRQAGDGWREAMALGQMGQVQADMGRNEQARKSFDLALQRHRELGDSKNEAQTSLFRGKAALKVGDFAGAAADFRHALMLHESLGWISATAECHFGLAHVAERRGRLGEALQSLQAGLMIAESMRDRVEVPSLQASFMAGVGAAYRLEVDLLMRLGRPEQAFEASERARARALLDLLAGSNVDRHSTLGEDLQVRRQDALDRLNAKAQRRLLLTGSSSPERLQAAVQELDAALVEMELVEAEVRREAGGAVLFAPIHLATAKRRVGEESLLLEYSLGEERSYLFAVGSNGFDAFELPGRQPLEKLTRRVVDSMRNVVAGSWDEGSEAGSELSRILLGPLTATLLGKQRILIVADGALHHLPFEALQLPGGSKDERVITRHLVTYAPSASVLAAERSPIGKRAYVASRTVAIFADPVYAPSDSRLSDPHQQRADVAALTSLANGDADRDVAPGGRLERLPGTRHEAQAIASLFAPDQVVVKSGFEANRQSLFSSELQGFKILHLATHGVTDGERPAMSGLALSMLDRRGRRQDGFLRLHDLAHLELSADLVVLSGCETAVGRRLEGEGLMGLTFGFFHAGAKQVIASRWKVRDRVTAALMTELYRQLQTEGAEPAAALREAQLFISAHREWRHPYYWSSFAMYQRQHR